MTDSDAPTIVQPNAADRQPRTDNGQAVITDPEAPYGWMTDPRTGQKRPKKRPGRQSRNVEAPRDRPANRARTAAPKAPKKSEEEYVKPVSDVTEGVWMILAATPKLEPKTAVLGINLADVTVKLRATASIVKDEAPGIVAGVSKMAAHSTAVAKAVDKLSEENGPAWILPAMFALLPFVAQTVNIWKSPATSSQPLADKTTHEWEDFLNEMMNRQPVEGQTVEPPAPRADIVLRAEPSDQPAA
jgi:hypothetical protein